MHNFSLDRLTRELNLPEWDFLLVGDGSGCDWNIGAGWACLINGRVSGWPPYRKLVAGGWSDGTNNIAELSAYFQALYFIDANLGKLYREKLNRSVLQVAIVTDSQFLVDSYRQQATTTGSLAPLWSGIRMFEMRGYALHFRHIPRLSITQNWAVDKVAGEARLRMQEEVENPVCRHGVEQNLDELNPG